MTDAITVANAKPEMIITSAEIILAEPRQPGWIGPFQASDAALRRPVGDASTGGSGLQSQGGPQPPRHNEMLRRSTKLATRSPWRGATAIGCQTGSAHVGTRHAHAVPP